MSLNGLVYFKTKFLQQATLHKGHAYLSFNTSLDINLSSFIYIKLFVWSKVLKHNNQCRGVTVNRSLCVDSPNIWSTLRYVSFKENRVTLIKSVLDFMETLLATYESNSYPKDPNGKKRQLKLRIDILAIFVFSNS